jgi:hypothetical protein
MERSIESYVEDQTKSTIPRERLQVDHLYTLALENRGRIERGISDVLASNLETWCKFLSVRGDVYYGHHTCN